MEKVRRQLSMLITLAQSDGDFHEKEKAIIDRIARAHGFPEDELVLLVQQPDPLNDLEGLIFDDKFDYLYSIILLMKADNEILDSELLFCQKIANSLGFQLAAFMELYPHVHVNMRDHHELKMLRKKLQGFLLS